MSLSDVEVHREPHVYEGGVTLRCPTGDLYEAEGEAEADAEELDLYCRVSQMASKST